MDIKWIRLQYRRIPHIQKYVNPNGLYSKNQTTQAYYQPISWVPTQSLISYENVIGYNTTVVSEEGSQYVWNTSVLQPNPFNVHNATSPPSTSYLSSPYMNTSWSWGIAPDVNTQSGIATISYANGLVGGPQPNFIWKGYNYSESVEPTYIQVGVNSSKAPSIVIQFQGNPGQQYYVQVINGNSMVENISVVGQQNTGIVDVTYNPAIMPLDPIFNLYTPSSPTPAPIPVPAPVKQPFDYTKFIVISGGLLAIIALAYYYGKSNKGRSGGYGGRRI